MARKKTATVDLKVRMKEPLRAMIEKAAKDRGVSLNAEAVDRISRSFQKEDAIGGPELAGFFQMVAGAVAVIEARTGKSCFEDWDTSQAVRIAIKSIAGAIFPSVTEAILNKARHSKESKDNTFDERLREIIDIGEDAGHAQIAPLFPKRKAS